MMSDSNTTQALRELGSNVALLSAKQLSTIPSTTLKEILKNLGPGVKWTQSQLSTLVQKQLGDKKVSLQLCRQLLSHMFSLSLHCSVILVSLSATRCRVRRCWPFSQLQ